MKNLLSFPHLNILDATPPEVISAAHVAGFSAVSLRLKPGMIGEAQHPMLGDSPMMRDCLSLLSDTNMQVLAIEAFWLRPDTVPADFRPEMEAAARLGAQTLHTIAGDSDLNRVKDNFAKLAELAGTMSLRLEFEYMAISRVNSLATALEILMGSGAPNVGVMIDPLHIARCGTTVEELKAIPRRYLHLFQLCDALLPAPPTTEAMLDEARFGRLLPGDGELPVAEWWDAMPRDIHLSIEVPLAATRHLSFDERAKTVMEGYRRFATQCRRLEEPE